MIFPILTLFFGWSSLNFHWLENLFACHPCLAKPLSRIVIAIFFFFWQNMKINSIRPTLVDEIYLNNFLMAIYLSFLKNGNYFLKYGCLPLSILPASAPDPQLPRIGPHYFLHYGPNPYAPVPSRVLALPSFPSFPSTPWSISSLGKSGSFFAQWTVKKQKHIVQYILRSMVAKLISVKCSHDDFSTSDVLKSKLGILLSFF